METGVLTHGSVLERDLSKRIAGAYATTAALTAMGSKGRSTGMLATVVADNSIWIWDADSTTSASASVLVPDDAPAAGRWLVKDTTPTAGDTAPVVDGTAAAGVSTEYSRKDHVHPESVASGTATLTAGTVDVACTGCSATSRIALCRTTADTCTSTVQYGVSAKTTDQFTIQAQVAAGTINVADVSTLDYIVHL
jgi:hypothetical protein